MRITPGAICLWRASDGVAIAGDVCNNNHPLSARWERLREPPRGFSWDPAMNRRAILRLAELSPRVVLFGHGRELRDAGKLREYAAEINRR